ncbi:MAG TPA: large conductance mechanosensitive channel protein MscL [Miltoncostaea sp.]|nr:large conductance mechanosensitive channel protein MscL [Miltoncostaea sp.]
MRNALRDFKEFVLKGDVVALAVAVIIATAFGAVVTAFVANIVTPLIAAIGGQPDFSSLDFTINGSRFQYGLFFNAVIAFLLIALIVFFLVVRPYNHFRKRFERGEDETVPPPEYVVETAEGASIADALNRRSADGWRVVSVGEAGDGRLSAVLVKGDA